jgi:hypothetical protein
MATGKINDGDVFNNWTVIKEQPRVDGKQVFMCKCVCGVRKDVRKCNLGNVTGCGCERSAYKARTYKATRKVRSAVKKVDKPVRPAGKEKQNVKSDKAGPNFDDRKKSPRELLEEHLEQARLDKQLKEIFE